MLYPSQPSSTTVLGEKLLHLKLIQFVVNIVTQFCYEDLHLLLIIISDISWVVVVVVWKIFLCLSFQLVHLVGSSHLTLPRLQSVKEEIKRHPRP